MDGIFNNPGISQNSRKNGERLRVGLHIIGIISVVDV
jgi:hypothetical protein